MTTVRHVSKCCSLGYSFNFSHKCPELVGPSSRFSSRLQSYAKTRITMLITAKHSGQLPQASATRRAQFSQNLACPQGTKAKPSIQRLVPTNKLHNTVMVCLQQLAFLVPTLQRTRWQQSVSTARRRRRNCRNYCRQSKNLRLWCHCFILALLIAVVDFSQTCLLPTYV